MVVEDGGPVGEAAEVGRLHVGVLVGLQGVEKFKLSMSTLMTFMTGLRG